MATQADAQTQFDLGIWYTLSLWPALSMAVANNWGGPSSSDKRDWFAGAISDLFSQNPDTDQLDVETVLLQVMQDEFDVNVEDESEVPVAQGIMKIKKGCEEGDFKLVEEVKERWGARGSNQALQGIKVIEHTYGEDGEELSSSEEEDDGDEEMGEAPQLAPVREKQEPEVDEDGFTKVVGKKRR